MAGLIRTLVSMRRTVLRHSPPGQRPLGWAAGAALVVLTWLAVGLAAPAARADVAMLLLALWGAGAALGPVTMSGPGVLRPAHFALLPLPRHRLAIGLLAVAFTGVASAFVLVALLAPVLLTGGAPFAVATAVLVALPTWVTVVTVSRLVFALLGSLMRTRLGLEISAVQFGIAVAAMLAGWMLVVRAFETVPRLLDGGLPDGAVASGLAVLPTSWPVLAAQAAARGDGTAVLGLLAAGVATASVLVATAVWVLRADPGGGRSRRGRRPVGSGVRTGTPVLPDTPLGAVVGRELRQWWRDPWRGLELRTGLYAGLAAGGFALLSVDHADVAPLAGLVVGFMACLAACNLYGQDGSAVWLTVVGQTATTERDDVRGRLLTVLLLFAPPSLVVSVALVALGDAGWAWPVVLAGVPALCGAAAGVAVLVSVLSPSPGVDPRRRVGPNDAGGEIGAQAQVAFWSTQILVAPTAVTLVVSFAAGGTGLAWLAVPVGVLNGVVVAWLLVRVAERRLAGRLPDLFTRIRFGRADREGDGTLGRLETAARRADERKVEAGR